MSQLKENLQCVQENIAKAAQKSGRSFEDITLVAVTKTLEVEYIKQAYDLGLRNFGENRVQELQSKFDKLPADIHWHMIGHLQTNKVRSVFDKVCLIHSLDSERLAIEINKRAAKNNIFSNILIEINIAEEDGKNGIFIQNTPTLIEQIQYLSNIRILGLMCVAPFVEKAEQNRIYFEKMRKLFLDIKGKQRHNVDMRFLSMGMSGDYEIAIEEGANIVRIGTVLFGSR